MTAGTGIPHTNDKGGAGRGRKLIGRKPVNLIVGWCGRFLFFVVPRQFSQILIPDWTYFHCPGTTLTNDGCWFSFYPFENGKKYNLFQF